MCEGVTAMSLIIAIIENMVGKLDLALPSIMGVIFQELTFVKTLS